MNRIGEAAHLAFIGNERFLIVRDVFPDVANQIVILAARSNTLARLAAIFASAFSVVVWAQGFLVSDFFKFI